MIMKRQILKGLPYAVLFLASFHFSWAQVADNFSDGDFTSSPVWQPDNAANWTIDNNRLRSNSSNANSIFYISTPSVKAIDAQWDFYVNLQFNTSSANYVDIFLTSDQADLTSAANNGYFVRIGGTPDEISLYKLTAGSPTLLINGTDGVTNASNNILRIKVIRDSNNVWTLARDASGAGSNFVMEGSVTDNTHSTSAFFGIRITQSTATFFSKHFFDDVVVGEIVVDTEPPSIVSVTPISATQLEVLFNENVEATSSQLSANYSVNNGVGNPTSAMRQADEKTVRLTFANPFPNATTSQLTVTGVKDILNNAIVMASQDFFFFQPVAAIGKDIIITEIFADPSPSVGLPEAEFIELYNRSQKIFDLQNWKLSDGSSTGILPTHLLYPGEYVILSATTSASQFNSFGATLGVPNFPTLNNSGDALTLSDNSNTQIDYVHYLDTWYRDEDKKQGGYTLELIDPENPCGEDENWVASDATTGGTPGSQNSVFANKPDHTGPKLISVIPSSSTELLIRFNEKLSDELPSTADFIIIPNISITGISFTDASLRLFTLTLGENLQPAITYSIAVQNISDCNKNAVQDDFNDARFGLPEEAAAADIVINEILFNPRPTGVDFIEVYNNSTKFINLKNWAVSNFVNGTILNSRLITADDFLLSPGEYKVFTENSNVVKGEYISAVESNLFQVADLPSFNDAEGTAALVDTQSNIIDYVSYTDDDHTDFLKDDEGVSLERVSFKEPSSNKSNWKSASSTAGYATPGYLNSNSRGDFSGGKIVISPEIFEPIKGIPDFTQIQYNFDKGGFVANIKILDFQGREIKQIANNTILGTSGFFRWDGDMNDGSKARVGSYTVWVEVFDSKGTVDTFRKRVVVAGKF